MPTGLQSFRVPQGPPSPELNPNPFTLSPFTSDEMGMDPEGISFDPVSFAAPSVSGDFKERLLSPTTPQDSLIASVPRGLMNDTRATDQEKETSWRDALSAMRLLEQYDVPTQLEIMDEMKRDLKDVTGIDVDAYANLNREGDPYMAASSVLIDANRAGYSTPQAISKALNAFNATRQAIKLPDPKQVEMALMLMNYSKEEQIRQQQIRAKGLEGETMVVGFEGDEDVIHITNRDRTVLDKMLVPYRKAITSDIDEPEYAWLNNGKVEM
jgi:hypothetical protein